MRKLEALVMESQERGWDVMAKLKTVRFPALGNARFQAVYGAIGEIRAEGDYAQFGVYRGRTAQLIAALTRKGRKLHLFDSFEGLPEDWTATKKAGHFSLTPDEIPQFDARIAVVHKGWFKDTVPAFVTGSKKPLAFVHMDADLYSSTIDVLFNANDIIAKDTIILFDEYAVAKWEADDEHRAFLEWVGKFGRRFDYLWRTKGPQVCVRITG